ncbi:hypothetical protein U3653_31415 [Nocardia sp. CDC186]|uniref:Uncharacterized protein n=1 Tax=Nocardia implantans TaxID=3108168 RepID=A0ABU6B5B6_9NOCA|nr:MULTISPECIES: hypothetical protein [unclassified Nocardia]MBF6196296.1 hypothetical protein [Nocardia beijingensis]MEA3527740.1 hypothetical protein [Nocardia sp. CDC192]MEB3514554.1 hypothetical protein [Nocardia sp. CDC186]
MLERIAPHQLAWFAAWVADSAEQADGPPLPATYDHTIAVLHCDAEPATSGVTAPSQGSSGTEGHPSDRQKAVLDRILLTTTGPGAPACLASYDADPGPGPALLITATSADSVPPSDDAVSAHALGDPPLGEIAERVNGHIAYLLVAAPLQDLVYTAWEARWDYEQPVTMLWPADRTWCLSSDPDLSYTVIGCDHTLAARILAEPVLRAQEL